MQKAIQVSESKGKEVFTVVAFRYDSTHSILYKTVNSEADVAEEVFGALKLDNADVISVRRVYPKCLPPK